MSARFDPYYQWLGIPPEHQPPHHYRLLGIELFESSESVIEKAADRQMGFLRGLQLGQHGALSQKLLGEVAAARLCLLDRASKSRYDEALRRQFARQAAAPLAPETPPVGEMRSAPPPAIVPVAALVQPSPAASAAGGKKSPSARPAFRSQGLWLGALGCAAGLIFVVLAALLVTDRPPARPSSPIAEQQVAPNRPQVPPPRPAAAKGGEETARADKTPRAEAESKLPPAPEPRGEIDAAAPPTDALPALGQPQPVAAATQPPVFGPRARQRPAKVKKKPVDGGSGGGNKLELADLTAMPFTKLDLPSGQSFSLSTITLAEKWFESRMPAESGVYIVEFPNAQPAELHAFLNAKLHGPSVALYESGGRRKAATYDNGQRDGPLYFWDETQQPVLYAEYRRGRRKGLACLFESGRPCFVQEADTSLPAAEYLVTWTGGDPTIHPVGQIRDKRLKALAAESAEKMAHRIAQADEEEAATKRELADWFRQKDQQLTQQNVAQANLAKRRAIVGAIGARGAAQQSAIERAMRQALSRAGL